MGLLLRNRSIQHILDGNRMPCTAARGRGPEHSGLQPRAQRVRTGSLRFLDDGQDVCCVAVASAFTAAPDESLGLQG